MIGFQTLPVEEHAYLQFTQCFECCRWEHIAKNCRDTKPTCLFCAEEHLSAGCRRHAASPMVWVNCSYVLHFPHHHRASDTMLCNSTSNLVENASDMTKTRLFTQSKNCFRSRMKANREVCFCLNGSSILRLEMDRGRQLGALSIVPHAHYLFQLG